MMHLLAASKTRPTGSILFYIGNIAPDAVSNRHDKDIFHLRNLQDRLPTLISLAKNTSGDFAEGLLLHLYVDWKWDTTIMQKYINETGQGWFAQYRNELSLAASYLFHHTDWAKKILGDMDTLDTACYGNTPGVSVTDVKNWVSRGNKWHNENNIGPSSVFTPDLVENFASLVAEEYNIWRALI